MHTDRPTPGAVVATAFTDAVAVAEYHSHWASADPFALAAQAQRLPAGTVGIGDAMVARETLRRSSFFNEFGLRFDLTQTLTGIIEHSATQLSGISINRGEGQARFGKDDASFLDAILPHVQRAVVLHRRLEGTEAMAENLSAAVDALPTAVVLLTARGTVAFTNRAARVLLQRGDGLTLDDVELRASTLRSAVGCVLRVADGTTIESLPAVLRVPRPSGARAYALFISPLPRRRRSLEPRPCTAAVFITDPGRIPPPNTAAIRALFSLTIAEAALVARLSHGLTLEETSQSLGLSIQTARTRLKTIFQKADTHRQADLVRLVLTTLMPMEGSGR